MSKISASFDDVTSLDERPIVAIFVSRLNLPQWMAEGILAKVLKFVTATAEARSAKVDGVA